MFLQVPVVSYILFYTSMHSYITDIFDTLVFGKILPHSMQYTGEWFHKGYTLTACFTRAPQYIHISDLTRLVFISVSIKWYLIRAFSIILYAVARWLHLYCQG